VIEKAKRSIAINSADFIKSPPDVIETMSRQIIMEDCGRRPEVARAGQEIELEMIRRLLGRLAYPCLV
jgi:hypothetical protein